jgi:hypothetical protein
MLASSHAQRGGDRGVSAPGRSPCRGVACACVCACVLLVCACARASQEEDQVEARRAARVDSVGARPGREAEHAGRGEVGAWTASVRV